MDVLRTMLCFSQRFVFFRTQILCFYHRYVFYDPTSLFSSQICIFLSKFFVFSHKFVFLRIHVFFSHRFVLFRTQILCFYHKFVFFGSKCLVFLIDCVLGPNFCVFFSQICVFRSQTPTVWRGITDTKICFALAGTALSTSRLQIIRYISRKYRSFFISSFSFVSIKHPSPLYGFLKVLNSLVYITIGIELLWKLIS